MNPHAHKYWNRAGCFVKKMYLTKARFAPHRAVARILRKAVIVSVAVPRGARVRFGESPYKHFVIVDCLADYYSMGRDHLPKSIIKAQDKKKRRVHDKDIVRQSLRNMDY